MTIVSKDHVPGRLPVAGEPRHPWKQWGLALITFGVYAAVQHHRINRELRDFGIDVDPTMATLAFVPGCVLVVPYVISAYRTAQRVAIAQETVGLTTTAQPEVAAIASLFTFLQMPYLQTQLNRVWVLETENESS